MFAATVLAFIDFKKSQRKTRSSLRKKSYKTSLWIFCIMHGRKKASRTFRTNHSVGINLCPLKELSRNSKVDEICRYFVQSSCAQEKHRKQRKWIKNINIELCVLDKVYVEFLNTKNFMKN